MRGRFHLTLVAGVGIAAVAGASAAERDPVSPAPLVSESAAQLRALKPEGATGREEIGQGRLRDALPTFEPANPRGAAAPLPPPRRPDADARRAAPATGATGNWLLDGYADAEKKNGARPGRNGGAEHDPLRSGADAATRDSGDQADSLKRTMAGVQSKLPNATETTMAPLMRQWLAGSPVKDIAMDAWRGGNPGAIARGPDEGSRLPGSRELFDRFGADRTAAGSGSEPLTLAGVGEGGSRRNPYLEAMAAPASSPIRTSVAAPATGRGLAPIAPPSSVAAAASALAPNPQDADKLRAKPTPPPSPEDDKKYFRQLKRF